jgi:hypothetical protein
LSAITETTPTRNENRWRGAHPFQPTGTAGGREPCTHRVNVELPVRARTEERFHRGQRHHRVVRLMLTVQRQEDLGVPPAEALQFQQLTADGDLTAE